MASNDANPEPPPWLTFEDYKKTNTLDFHKPQETNPFMELISHLEDENIVHILKKCILALPAVSDNEEEEDADSPKDDTVVLNDLFELVEMAKRNKLTSPKETSREKENFPSSSTSKTPNGPSAFAGAYSSSPSPNMETRYIEYPDRASNFSRKRVSSSSFSHLSSRSSDSSSRHASQTSLSSNNRSSESGSRVWSSSRRYCTSRRHRSNDSCSTSPKNTYYHKIEDFHKRSRCQRSYDSYSSSPEGTYYHKKEGCHKRSCRHRSYDSCRRSPSSCRKDRHKCHKSSRSLFRERSSSSGSTDVEGTLRKRLKRNASMKACSIQFGNSHVDSEDEYSLILSEKMKRRRLLLDSDEEHDARMEKARSLAATARIDSEEHPRVLPKDNLIKMEFDDESEKVSDAKFLQDNKKNVKGKSEIQDKKFNIPDNFFCDLCHLSLNSELMWESHVSGKSHAKQVKKQTVYEIAKESLAVPATPSVVFKDAPHFANAVPGIKRMRINAIPRLQRTIDETRNRPVVGLDYVQEIISASDVGYYCELCDAPCQSISIMPHLLGIRHQLRFLQEIAPVFYEKNEARLDKPFMLKVSSILKTHERSVGRGSIKVFREVDDTHTRPAFDQPKPSWRNSSFPSIKKEPNHGKADSKDRWLDLSKGVFYCTLCDAHMNNCNMWEAHVRGKRHLANAKKFPGECISKMKSERLHGATSNLEKMIDEELIGKLVVGLDFIRETRGSNGELYNCFLCGSCSTNFDILDHILLLKHRTKYLEKLHAGGIENAIEEIDSLELKENSYRIALINRECIRMVKRYGRGKVEVYQSKN